MVIKTFKLIMRMVRIILRMVIVMVEMGNIRSELAISLVNWKVCTL